MKNNWGWLFRRSVMYNSLQPHGLQHARVPCLSPSPRACSNSCPWSRWCHPSISSSVTPFSFCLQSFPSLGSFLMSQLLESGGQSLGASPSASVLPTNIQDWFSLGWTGWISLHSKGPSRIFSHTTVQKHQFFGFQPSLDPTFTPMWRRQWHPTPDFLAWKTPWMEEPGGLPSMGLHRVGHNWSDLAAAPACLLFRGEY